MPPVAPPIHRLEAAGYRLHLVDAILRGVVPVAGPRRGLQSPILRRQPSRDTQGPYLYLQGMGYFQKQHRGRTARVREEQLHPQVDHPADADSPGLLLYLRYELARQRAANQPDHQDAIHGQLENLRRLFS